MRVGRRWRGGGWSSKGGDRVNGRGRSSVGGDRVKGRGKGSSEGGGRVKGRGRCSEGGGTVKGSGRSSEGGGRGRGWGRSRLEAILSAVTVCTEISKCLEEHRAGQWCGERGRRRLLLGYYTRERTHKKDAQGKASVKTKRKKI